MLDQSPAPSPSLPTQQVQQPGAAPASGAAGAALDGAVLTRATVSLLGLVAYTSLASFDRLALDSSAADDLSDELLLARLAASRLEQMHRVESALQRHQADGRPTDLVTAMLPFRRSLDEFHRATQPTQWAERLLKVHLSHGLAHDLVRQCAPNLPASVRGLLEDVVRSGDLDDRVEQQVRAAIAAHSSDAGRLSLFARRVLGEALGQGQRIAARDTELTSLLTGARPGSIDDLARISQMMDELSAGHSQRVDALGLFG